MLKIRQALILIHFSSKHKKSDYIIQKIIMVLFLLLNVRKIATIAIILRQRKKRFIVNYLGFF